MLYTLIFLGLAFSFFDISNAQAQYVDFLEELSGKNQGNQCGKSIKKLDTWNRLKMLDACSKSIPSGILNGNFYDLGSYDECLSIASKEGDVHGKYCLLTFPLEKIGILFPTPKKTDQKRLKSISKKTSLLGYHFGLCIPEQCNSQEIASKIHKSLVADDDFCYTNKKKDMNLGSIIALTVVGAIVVISIVSTIYDLFIFYFHKKVYHEFCIVFSMFTNGKKIFKTSSLDDTNQLLCLHGIRTLSMMWVVLGHNYAIIISYTAVDNLIVVNDWMDRLMNMFIINGTLSVDTFFTIAGLLVVYTYLKTPILDLKTSIKRVPLAYFHRYLRLTPALGILVLCYSTGLIEYLGDGPKWGSLKELFIDGCQKSWWSTLLYIQNYDGADGMCVDQSWYLSVDMQLFILSPLVLIPLRRWPRITLSSIFVLISAGVFIPFYFGYSNKFSGNILKANDENFGGYYVKTHERFGPYVIGMLAGLYLHKIKHGMKSFHLKNYQAILLWAVILTTLLICVLDGHKFIRDEEDAWADAFYMGFNRSVWSCAVCLAIILCVSGHGGPIATFLSLPVFQIMSKLSYSIYLVHYFVLFLVNVTSRGLIHFSNFHVCLQFFGNFVLISIVSLFFCLLFESPIIVLEKIILPTKKKVEDDDRV